MTLDEVKAQLRQHLAETYGRDEAALIYNLADLESNFQADATNKRSSASGLTQITSGHWTTLTGHLNREIRAGRLSAQDLPEGMTLENMGNFDLHKFDEVNAAFMTKTNIDFLKREFVKTANTQRSATGAPRVENFNELTKGNFALQSFLLAGGHKDGWGIVKKEGPTKGTGFGNAIRNGEVDLPHLFDTYERINDAAVRSGAEITDGIGHGLTYAMYASDNTVESSGGPKLQLNAGMVKQAIKLKHPSVRVDHKIVRPLIDRAQQADPGFEPTDANLDQWLTRLDQVDPVRALGANDIQSTDRLNNLNDESLPRSVEPSQVALPETRTQSEDPSVQIRSGNRLQNRPRRIAEEVIGRTAEFLVPEANAAEAITEAPFAPRRSGSEPTTLASQSTALDGLGEAPRRNPLTGQEIDGSRGINPFTRQPFGSPRPTNERNPFTGQPIGSERPTNEINPFTREPIGQATQEPTLADTVTPPQRGSSPDPELGPSGGVESQPEVPLDEQLAGQQNAQNEALFQRIVNDAQTTLDLNQELERARSAEIVAGAQGRGEELRAQSLQDLAIGLTPNFDLPQTDFQGFQSTTLQNFGVPDQLQDFGNATPSNTQLQAVVDQSRITDDDFLFAGAADLLQDQERGSLADFVGNQRGTNFEAETQEGILRDSILATTLGDDGILDDADRATLLEIDRRRQALSPVLSANIIDSSRGLF